MAMNYKSCFFFMYALSCGNTVCHVMIVRDKSFMPNDANGSGFNDQRGTSTPQLNKKSVEEPPPEGVRHRHRTDSAAHRMSLILSAHLLSVISST